MDRASGWWIGLALLLAGEQLGAMLEDISVFGCLLLTDGALVHLATPVLRRVNYCGCYKISSAGLRYLLSQVSTGVSYTGLVP